MHNGKTFKFKNRESLEKFYEIWPGSSQQVAVIDFIGMGIFEVVSSTLDGSIREIKRDGDERLAAKQHEPLIVHTELLLFFVEVPHPGRLGKGEMQDEPTDQDLVYIEEQGFNPNSLENLHRVNSVTLFELANSVKGIEEAGYNGGIAQQINALKKYQDILQTVQQQIIKNRPMLK